MKLTERFNCKDFTELRMKFKEGNKERKEIIDNINYKLDKMGFSQK